MDIIPEMQSIDLSKLTRPGSAVEVGPALVATGGAVPNTGRGLARLGISTRLMGKVGDDPFGDIILRLIREDHPALADDMIVAPGETSSYTIVFSLPGVDRFFWHCVGANDTFGADDVSYDRLRDARLFHFGYPPFMREFRINDGAALVDMFRRAKAAGVITSLDMALPDPNGPSGQVNWRLILERTLPHVDLFLPSLDELLFMVGGNDPTSESADTRIMNAAAGVLAMMGAGVVVIKLGSRGLYLRTGPEGFPALDAAGWRNRELWAPCFRPEPLVGTTGAGDAAIAGFLAAVLRGQLVEEAVTTAAAVGACNVEAADALSGVISWEATQARIDAGWARDQVTIDAPGWAWDDTHSVWVGPNDARS
ncbi:MAG: carbohydrate kinase family protein [Anaerolineae bacterium]|nr:carbohydrate kinase family protein [Anaerolineae bacterium]